MTTIRIALVFLITATVAFAQNGNSNSKVRTAWVVEFPDTQLLAPFSDNLGHIAVAGSHTNFPYAALFDDKGRMSAETFLSTPLTVQAATSGSDGSIYLSGRPNGIGAIPATVIA